MFHVYNFDTLLQMRDIMDDTRFARGCYLSHTYSGEIHIPDAEKQNIDHLQQA